MNNIRNTYRYIRNSIIYRYVLKNAQQLEYKKFQKILIIAPHPDDEALGCGGLMSFAIKNNIDISLIILSKGENSTHDERYKKEDIKKVRIGFMYRANESIGLSSDKIHILDFEDGQINLNNTNEINKLKKLIFEIKPEAIFIPCDEEGWTDHINTIHILNKIKNEYNNFLIYTYCVWFWYTMPFQEIFKLNTKKMLYVFLEKDILLQKRNMIKIYLNNLDENGFNYSGILPTPLVQSCSWKKELYFKINN